jgi:hypothetical protein
VEDQAYRLYFLEKKHGLHFIQSETSLPPDSSYRGSLNYKEASFLFYEVQNVEIEFLSTEKDDLWRVTPYEILYTRTVTDIPIHHLCIDLFKYFPGLCFVDEHEVPVVAYLGLGASEIKEQILLQSKNDRKGLFGQGHYFYDYKRALQDARYKMDDYLIRLDNPGIQDFQDTVIDLREGRFYQGKHDLGDASGCLPVTYTLYYYDEESIYLKSNKPHHCKIDQVTRKEDGFVMRYLLFLKNHTFTKRKDYDSYAYDSTYMVRNADDFICLSYHSIKKNKEDLHGESFGPR